MINIYFKLHKSGAYDAGFVILSRFSKHRDLLSLDRLRTTFGPLILAKSTRLSRKLPRPHRLEFPSLDTGLTNAEAQPRALDLAQRHQLRSTIQRNRGWTHQAV